MPMTPNNMSMHKVFSDKRALEAAELRAKFETLRIQRNKEHEEIIVALCGKFGMTRDQIHSHNDPNACYCNCGNQAVHDGTQERLCEHRWNGKSIVMFDGHVDTVTCSLCGYPAFSHDMRYSP